MMNTSPLSPLPAARLMDTVPPPQADLLSPLLPANAGALLYGPGGVGKSFFALGIAWAAASGGSFLGWQAPRPHHVLYVDGEMGAATLRERLALFGPPPATLDLLLPHGQGPILDLARPESQLRLMEGWGCPELVVLDSLASLAALRAGDVSWGRLKRFLLHQRMYGRAMLLVHHANKRGLPRGSTQCEDVLDLVIALRRPRDGRPADGARFELHFDKARHLKGAAAQPVLAELRTEHGRAGWHWTSASRLDRAAALLAEGATVKAMGAAIGVSLATAYRLRDAIRQRSLSTNLPPKENKR